MLMGGSLGSSLVPTVIGYLMRLLGPSVLPLCVLVLGGAMVAAYIGAHQSLTKAAAERRRKHM